MRGCMAFNTLEMVGGSGGMRSAAHLEMKLELPPTRPHPAVAKVLVSKTRQAKPDHTYTLTAWLGLVCQFSLLHQPAVGHPLVRTAQISLGTRLLGTVAMTQILSKHLSCVEVGGRTGANIAILVLCLVVPGAAGATWAHVVR